MVIKKIMIILGERKSFIIRKTQGRVSGVLAMFYLLRDTGDSCIGIHFVNMNYSTLFYYLVYNKKIKIFSLIGFYENDFPKFTI